MPTKKSTINSVPFVLLLTTVLSSYRELSKHASMGFSVKEGNP